MEKSSGSFVIEMHIPNQSFSQMIQNMQKQLVRVNWNKQKSWKIQQNESSEKINF